MEDSTKKRLLRAFLPYLMTPLSQLSTIGIGTSCATRRIELFKNCSTTSFSNKNTSRAPMTITPGGTAYTSPSSRSSIFMHLLRRQNGDARDVVQIASGGNRFDLIGRSAFFQHVDPRYHSHAIPSREDAIETCGDEHVSGLQQRQGLFCILK